MSILNSTSPAKKYDHLGVYYRKSFLTPEEVAVLSNYSSLYKSESDKYEVGFISSKFIQNAAESYQYKNQVKEIFTKIKNEMKSVYNIDSLYLNIVQNIKISSSSIGTGASSSSYSSKDSEDKNGIVVKKFVLPTSDGWTPGQESSADPAWCVIVGLSTDTFEEGGDINVGSVSEKINSGDVIWFSSSVSKSYSVSSFDPVSDINTPVGDTTPDTVKNFLDLTMTDIQEGYWQ